MYDDYDALIFDMDGTLVDSGQLHEFAWLATLDKYAIPIDRPLMRSLAGVPTWQTLEILLQKFALDSAASLAQMNHFRDQFMHDNMHKYVQATALRNVVQHYHGKKPMAVGTGAYTQEAKTILALCGLDKYFEIVVGADQVTQHKPAPDTFLRCAELLGVTPTRCVVFEDSTLGLQAAARAGMVGVDVLAVHDVGNNYFL